MSAYRDDLLRAEKGRLDLTNAEIADAAGLSEETVRKVLRGEPRVILENVAKVAAALGLTLQQVCEPRAEVEPANA